jgi:hypothetical protein
LKGLVFDQLGAVRESAKIWCSRSAGTSVGRKSLVDLLEAKNSEIQADSMLELEMLTGSWYPTSKLSSGPTSNHALVHFLGFSGAWHWLTYRFKSQLLIGLHRPLIFNKHSKTLNLPPSSLRILI